MRSIVFIAMLFCAAVGALAVGGVALYRTIDFHLHAKGATMELADPTRKIALRPVRDDVYFLDVRYVSPDSSVVVQQKAFAGDLARRIVGGAKISVVYYTNNPRHADYGNEERPSPWGWLALGIALMATFAYALKQKRQEAG